MSSDPSRNRSRGNQESKEAHEKIVPYKAEKYERILKLFLRHGPMTVHSVAFRMGYGAAINKVSGRLSELKGMSLIHKVDKLDGSAVLDVNRAEIKKRGMASLFGG